VLHETTSAIRGFEERRGRRRTESAFWIVRPQMPDHASQNLIVWSSAGVQLQVSGQHSLWLQYRDLISLTHSQR
jgi:hypothetical protein